MVKLLNRVLGFIAFSLNVFALAAQGQGVAGITQATTELKTYFEPASNLILAIGAIVGLIGGVRCYIKWNTGDQDVMKSVMGWGGACIFLVVVALVIRAFFL
jgi:hypothetical protein